MNIYKAVALIIGAMVICLVMGASVAHLTLNLIRNCT